MQNNKRPLEAIDANARSSNSSGNSKGKAAAPTAKRPKYTHRTIDAALARARDVTTSMLPSVDARKKTIDQSIYVKGTLTSKQHDVPRETITFSIMSDKTSSAQLAALPIVLKGPWVNAHLAGDALSENHSIVLAFKEGKIGLDCSTQSLSGSKPTRFPVYLLFDRGVELWTSEEPLQIAAGVTGSESTWRHLKLFAQAQHANTKSARRSDSNGPAKESIEEAQQNWNASKDTDSLAETSPFQIPAAQSNARREETAEADSQISPPPTGITQIEAGSSPPARSTDEDAPQAAMKNTKGLEFETICRLRERGPPHRDVNLIGVAIHDSARVFEASGGANVTIRFVDPSVNSASADEWQGGTWLGVTYLNSSKEQFPDVQIGDVLLIRLAKTVSYSTYTRLSVFSDQVCDWVCLPADVVRGLPEAALFEPIHANAFRTCPGAERPDALERKHMQRLALWSREQMIASYLGTVTAATGAAENSMQFKCSSIAEQNGPSRVRLFSTLRAPSEFSESAPFDFICRVIGQPWQGVNYIAMYVTDYTSNGSSNLEPGTADGAMMVRPDMILKVLLWQNEASNEIMEKALDSVNSGSSILFKGLRVRHVNGALHANGRLNKPDFEIVVLRPDDLQSLALVQRQQAYMDQIAKTDKNDAAIEAREKTPVRSPSNLLPQLKPVKGNEFTRLRSLRPPADLRDPSAYFDCACEIVADVYSNEMYSMTTLFITDFTINELFWQNASHCDYPRSRIIMQVAVFGEHQRAKVAALRQGDRVALRNVRCKLDRQGNLEGHVGERNMFCVEKLAEADDEYRLLETSRMKCLGGASDASLDPGEPAPNIGPSKAFEGVACKFAGHPVDDAILQPLSLDCEKVFRVRGRVIDYSPQDFDAFLVSKCTTCQRHLARDERLCRACEDGVLGTAIIRQWCFSLRIEIEPSSCNIEFDGIEPKRAFWIVVIEGEGDTVFMNGLEPVDESMHEAKRLLTQIVDNPSEGNQTNPVFDFCVKKTAGQRLLLLCDTAIRRNGRELPWV